MQIYPLTYLPCSAFKCTQGLRTCDTRGLSLLAHGVQNPPSMHTWSKAKELYNVASGDIFTPIKLLCDETSFTSPVLAHVKRQTLPYSLDKNSLQVLIVATLYKCVHPCKISSDDTMSDPQCDSQPNTLCKTFLTRGQSIGLMVKPVLFCIPGDVTQFLHHISRLLQKQGCYPLLPFLPYLV